MAVRMQHSPADVTARLLTDLGLGAEPSKTRPVSWPVYTADRPDLPDNLICVTDTAPRHGGKTMPDSEPQVKYGVQVYVRARDPRAGYDKANAIAVALDATYQETVRLDSSVYLVHNVSRSGGLLPIGKEGTASARCQFTLNLLVTVRQRA